MEIQLNNTETNERSPLTPEKFLAFVAQLDFDKNKPEDASFGATAYQNIINLAKLAQQNEATRQAEREKQQEATWLEEFKTACQTAMDKLEEVEGFFDGLQGEAFADPRALALYDDLSLTHNEGEDAVPAAYTLVSDAKEKIEVWLDKTTAEIEKRASALPDDSE